MKSELWHHCLQALKVYMQVKTKRKWQKGYTEIVGYSRHFDYPKCYGMIARFELSSFNNDGKFFVTFGGFQLMT
jgi:hypothetical protein